MSGDSCTESSVKKGEDQEEQSVASAKGVFDQPLLALSYSSSAAPAKSEDEDSELLFQDLDFSEYEGGIVYGPSTDEAEQRRGSVGGESPSVTAEGDFLTSPPQENSDEDEGEQSVASKGPVVLTLSRSASNKSTASVIKESQSIASKGSAMLTLSRSGSKKSAASAKEEQSIASKGSVGLTLSRSASKKSAASAKGGQSIASKDSVSLALSRSASNRSAASAKEGQSIASKGSVSLALSCLASNISAASSKEGQSIASKDSASLALSRSASNKSAVSAAGEQSITSKDSVSLALSRSGSHKSEVTAVSSKEQDVESSRDPDSDSTTSASESTKAEDDSALEESEVTTEEIESKPAKKSLPPLFPRRTLSNAGSKKNHEKFGSASFFGRSRSNPIKPEHTEKSLEKLLKASSEDGMARLRRNLVPSSSRSIASVPSCAEDSVEIIAMDSRASAASTAKSEARDDTMQDDAKLAATSEVTKDADSVVATEEANSKGNTFTETVNGIYDTLSSVSNEIQDPWPNPWSDAGPTMTAAVGGTPNPHAATPTDNGESVIENVVGMVLNSNVSGAPTENKSEGNDAEPQTDEILPNPSACNSDRVEALLVEACDIPQIELNSTVNSTKDSKGVDLASCTSAEYADENIENPAELLEDWKELLTTADTVGSDKSSEKGDEDKKEKPRRQSSLWKRTRSMVKNRYSNASQQAVVDESKKVDRPEQTKKTKGQKFKLGYLCLLSPCSKKLSTIEEVDESPEGGANTRPTETKTEQVLSPAIENNQEVDSEQIVLEVKSQDDLVEILGSNEGSPASSPPAESPAREEQKAMDTPSAAEPIRNSVETFGANIEESKSDLIQLDYDVSKQEKSWLSDLQSIAESYTGHEPEKTFSGEMSTLGELDDGITGRHNLFGNINFYIGAASKAVQHNLYDVPIQEFEKLRDMACGSGADQPSLLDNGVTATESHDSIRCKKAGEGVNSTGANPFSVVFSELVEVLECGPGNSMKRPTTKPSTTRFEEEKIEMFGSTSVGY